MGIFLWSAYHPKDYATWFLEVFPALVGFIVLAVTRETFPLTRLAYILILIHCIILMVGGKYTYAEVPLFNWIKEIFNSSRNNYDKVGHFAQGLVPFIIARELFIRKKVINGENWLIFLTVCFCLAVSAFYELIEWWVALFSKEGAEAFLGTQGYVWDTQTDIFMAMIGAVCAQIFLSKIHNQQIKMQVS